MNIIELFSGIGGFSKALEEAGYTIARHYFSEIDKHAIANYKYNFPNAEYIGDVKSIQSGSFTGIDIITFGSPCQDFSLAGKRKGLEGERSSLIEYAIQLISDLRPSVFIWENVKGAFSSNGSADFWAILQAFANIGDYRLEWQLLNTKWFLPQNRERIYLVGHLDGRSKPGVFPISEDDFIFRPKEKSEKNGLQTQYSSTVTSRMGQRNTDTFISVPKIAGAITGGGHSGGLHSDMITIQMGAIRGRNTTEDKTEQHLEINKEGISNALTSVQKDNVVIQLNPSTESGGTQPYQHNRVYSDQGLMPALTCDKRHTKIFLSEPTHKHGEERIYMETAPTIQSRYGTGGDNIPYVNNIRRLTEIECERLQGFPDDWTKFGDYDGKIKPIPKTQRYKMLGNAVTVNVAKEVVTRLKLE